ncbi:P-loop ATPase, Sll1717 family [Marinoscillum pacificum]|uniref:P-loop ATPase, Sll1717 family n=1 Tax=Marinoscillum pacificum TaxID=392723 RepID=UPI0021582841|nr:hypothetical protein [Marinoscillum pacificum]
MSKKYRIRKNLNIGSPDAETDEILFDVYVEHEVLEEIIDTKSQKSILLGRTGSGKSAVIRYIEEKCSNVTRIEPGSLSLRYLSNSTVLRYFRDLDVNLSLFFKVLWKHVFVVELLKLYFPDDYNKEKKSIWIQNIREAILKIGKSDPRKEKALKYLDNWTDKFWLDAEYQIKELEKSLVDGISSKTGLSINELGVSLNSSSQTSSTSRTEIKHKAESVIHEVQSKELIEIFNIMKSDLFTDHQKKFYIVIDDLDKEWIETEFKYNLIDAMVEVIKEIRQFKGVKIIVSLRENLNDLLKLGSMHEGGQREKLRPLYADMTWEEKELKILVDNRLINITNHELNVAEAFYDVRRTGETGFKYVLDRTYMRPRDIISFVNYAFQKANSKTSFTKDVIYKAEVPYSTDRFHALEDEWRENYGEIGLVTSFLNGINNGFRLKSLHEDQFEELYLEVDTSKHFKGGLEAAINDWKSDKIKFIVFAKRLIYILYHIGIIGVKKGPTFSTAFFYDELEITRMDISNNNKFYVHPSLYSHFKVNTMEQLPEDI